MAHVDPAHLVELALGNGVSDDDADALRHITGCGRCREELGLMARVVTAARGVGESDLPAAPPERVWRRIAQELTEAEADVEAGVDAEEGVDAATAPLSAVPLADRCRTARPALVLALLTGVSVVWWGRRWWSRNRSGRRPASDCRRPARPG
ncbi:hypothetical protein AB0A94_17145 [Streptomyces sp. NPDC044984]|uniref:hypothetical protein n=1 Tax=Streptomyces sp. NPDC044984 TaxID=3154335 RepID=UPI003406C2A2